MIDWGHMMEALNKLDAGVQEKILLLSRDEMSMLVASYADIKVTCFPYPAATLTPFCPAGARHPRCHLAC